MTREEAERLLAGLSKEEKLELLNLVLLMKVEREQKEHRLKASENTSEHSVSIRG